MACSGLYALSGAGKIRPLPLLRAVLSVVTAIYLMRGLLIISETVVSLRRPYPFRLLLFSATALCVGLAHLVGTARLYRTSCAHQARSSPPTV